MYIILLQDLFILFVGFSRQESRSGLPFPSPVDHILSDKKKKGMTEDEMVGWHHRLNGHGLGWTLGVGDGQGGLACCGSWGCKVGHD